VDALLAPAIPDSKLRAFLLHGLVLDGSPRFRFAIDRLARDMPVLEDFPYPEGARFTGPTLFIIGGRSTYVRPEHRPLITSLFPAARFVTLPEAGHWVHADDPEGVLAALEAFLPAAP
jgi:pimeloyl-ACP methyl ester carboxylesterase